MAAPKHLIKKYANRKLYDTETSRYITLDGISELVRDGHEIEVVDRDTGRDLTPLILSQIVVGEEKRTEGGTAERLQDRGQALVDYVRRRVERGRSELEELIDLAVERALTRLSIPTRRDLEALNTRLDELEARLNRLATRADGGQTPPPRTRTGVRAQ